MRPVTQVDVASIQIFLTQLFDDLFRVEMTDFSGVDCILIIGKAGAIPEDYCEKVIEELSEYHYNAEESCLAGHGRAVVVKGVE